MRNRQHQLAAAFGINCDTALRHLQRRDIPSRTSTDQDAILLLPYVCCDEALMEAVLGSAGGRATGRRRLDHACEWVERIELANFLPRIDRVAANLWD